MLALSNHTRIFVYSGPTDFRKGFNGLSGLVAEHFDVELLSGHLFLFCNRSRDRIKLLYWDNDGLAIWYKRLEAGSYQLPSCDEQSGALEINQTQLSLLLSGIDLTSVKHRKRYRAA
jgi:transposase